MNQLTVQLFIFTVIQLLILNYFRRSTTDNVGIVETGFIRPPSLYGHIHLGLTGGSELNGLFATKYERVCGHKGYSYDYFKHNTKVSKVGSEMEIKDSFSKIYPRYNRGRVPPSIMNEIGYEDCDYISLETDWQTWPKLFGHWDQPVELHLPCRDPIDHLMSYCNHEKHTFDCESEDLIKEMKKCHVYSWNGARFSNLLLNNMTVKCYDFPNQFTKYVDRMDKLLQQRRVKIPYSRRNTPRNHSKECIWKDKKHRKRFVN